VLNIAEGSGSAGIEFIDRSTIEEVCPEIVRKVLVPKALVSQGFVLKVRDGRGLAEAALQEF